MIVVNIEEENDKERPMLAKEGVNSSRVMLYVTINFSKKITRMRCYFFTTKHMYLF